MVDGDAELLDVGLMLGTSDVSAARSEAAVDVRASRARGRGTVNRRTDRWRETETGTRTTNWKSTS